MLRILLSGGMVLATLGSCGVPAGVHDPAAAALLDNREGPALRRFTSARAFERYLKSLRRPNYGDAPMMKMEMAPLPSLSAAPAEAPAPELANPAITNNQTVGVDEGGIVKQIGRFLVVLQDGRLFSADLGDGAGAPLRLADRIDVYRSWASAASWYDEMLVVGDRILVTAYSYSDMASEISVFRIDDRGRIAREGRFLLSSADYYSTENYATRLVGDKLVFYAPFPLEPFADGLPFRWPRLRRADGDGEAGAGEALFGPTDVYAPPGKVESPVLHTVSVCPLREKLDCRTTALIGPAMREFYVSPTDAFLWVGAPDGLPWSIDYANRRRRACPEDQYAAGADEASMLYRLPLDGGPIGAVAGDGVPADQFAFDSSGGRFRALLMRHSPGCVAFDAPARLALLDIPLSAFGPRVRRVADRAYASLPPINVGELENRFVGNWLLYGGRTGGWPDPEEKRPQESTLVTVPLARPAAAERLKLPHNALRIERAGTDAVVTGYRDSGGLSLSYVSLTSGRPRLTATTLLPRRFESEGRSHAFNAWIRPDGSGLMAIPTSLREWRSGRGWSDSESSDLSFVAVSPAKSLAPAGELGLRGRKPSPGYRCEVSCVDWYGNSRPIFTGGRVFGLMGTELVEGKIERGQMRELARLDLTGRAAAGARSGKR